MKSIIFAALCAIGTLLPHLARCSPLGEEAPDFASDMDSISIYPFMLVAAADSVTSLDSVYTIAGTAELYWQGSGATPLAKFLAGSLQLDQRGSGTLYINTQVSLPLQLPDSLNPSFPVQDTIAIPSLINQGINLLNKDSIEVFSGVILRPGGLSFAKASSTGEPMIRLQGSIGFPKLGSFEVAIQDSNYLQFTAPNFSPSLTGLSVVMSDTVSFLGQSLMLDSAEVNYSSPDTGSGFGSLGLSGNASLVVAGCTLKIQMGSSGSPGISIGEGVLDSLNVSVEMEDTFNLFGVTFLDEELGIIYNNYEGKWGVWGHASMTVSSGSSPDTLTFSCGTSATNPGLLFANDRLDSLDFSLNGSFQVYGLSIAPQNLSFKCSDCGSSDGVYSISGGLTIPSLWDVSANFGNEGMKVDSGKFKVDGFAFNTGSPINLGVFEIDTLAIAFSDTSGDNKIDLLVVAGVLIPGLNDTISGGFSIVDGKLNSVEFKASGLKVPIFDTGLFLSSIGGSLKNLESLSQLQVSADVGVYFVEKSMISASGQVVIDGNGLILDGTCNAFDGLVAEGDFDLNLDWADGDYKASTKWTIEEVFQFEIDFDLNGGEVIMEGEADLIIPKGIPWVGGDKIADADFYLQYGQDLDNFAAAWFHIPFVTAGIEAKLDKSFDVSFIGGGTIKDIENSMKTDGNNSYVYTSTFSMNDTGCTYITLIPAWQTPITDYEIEVVTRNGTISQDSFNLPGSPVMMPDSMRNSQYCTLFILSSDTLQQALPQGAYSIRFTTPTKLDTDSLPLQVHYGIPLPTLAIDTVGQSGGQGFIVYSMTSSDLNSTHLSFYIEDDNSGYDGRRLGTVSYSATDIAQDTFFFPVPSAPEPYYFYGTIMNKVDSLQYSAYTSQPFTFKYDLQLSATYTDSALLGYLIPGASANIVGPDTLQVFLSDTSVTGVAGLSKGDYAVTISLPPGFDPQDSTEQLGIKDSTLVFNLSSYALSSVYGVIGTDTGKCDKPDSLLSGWVVYLVTYGADSTPDTSSCVSGTAGYRIYFPEEYVGGYKLCLRQQEDWYMTCSSCKSGTIDTNDTTFVKKDWSVLAYGNLSGFVFQDSTGTGEVPPDSAGGLSDWWIYIVSDSGLVDSSVTNSKGVWKMDSVFPDSYTVMVKPRFADWVETWPVDVYDSTSSYSFPDPVPSVPTWIAPVALTVGDFSGDGLPDLAFPTSEDRILWYENLGKLQFNSGQQLYQFPSEDSVLFHGLLAFQGDEDSVASVWIAADQMAGSDSIAFVTLENQGSGTFSSSVTRQKGLVASNIVQLQFGEGEPEPYFLWDNEGSMNCITNWANVDSFNCQPYATPGNIVGTDLNQDGLGDLLLRSHDSDILIVAEGTDDSTEFNLSEFAPIYLGDIDQVLAADLDNDGYPDVVTLQDSIRYIENDKGELLRTAFDAIGPVSEASLLLSGDLNADGWIDLLDIGAGFAYMNNPDQDFQSQNLFLPQMIGGQLADLNGDGYPELVGIKADGTVVLFSNISMVPAGIPIDVSNGSVIGSLNFGFLDKNNTIR